MSEISVNNKWYRRSLRRSPRSDIQRHHSSRPNEEHRWQEHRYSYPPSTRRVVTYHPPDPTRIQGDQVSTDTTFGCCCSTRASLARSVRANLEPRYYRSAINHDSVQARMSRDNSSPSSAHDTPPYGRFEWLNEDYLDSSTSFRDDVYYVEDYTPVSVDRVPVYWSPSHHPRKGSYGSSYSDPCSINQDENYYFHVLDNPVEEVNCSSVPSNMFDYQHDMTLPDQDSGYLDEDTYSTFADSDINLPVSKEFVDKMMIDGMAGRMETMVEGVIAREEMLSRAILEQEVEQVRSRRFVDTFMIEQQETDFSNIMQEMDSHIPPKPRSKWPEFVNLNHVHIRKPRTDQDSVKQTTENRSTIDPKTQLERYNKWWTDVQTKSSTAKRSLETIPHLPPNRHTSGPQGWEWAAHKFFCLAFNLQPISIPQEDTSVRLTFTSPTYHTPTQRTTNLQSLRTQLKLEKVRWHEDKLRSVLGDDIARDERSKSIWSAVIGLKKLVERALEVESEGR